jgi:adhesin/invasin
VTFSTSDTDPGIVLPADYTFTAADAGVHTFPGGATLITSGDQTVTTTDTVSGITGSVTVTVGPGP